ncbi:hypothetical protein DL96DRAFT_1173019 [Flagelloscypha sp. PMI_526]|nr:hypothetical protein DL96DRAFT_1173019 [Flagelloscypha sp. PMI_526]
MLTYLFLLLNLTSLVLCSGTSLQFYRLWALVLTKQPLIILPDSKTFNGLESPLSSCCSSASWDLLFSLFCLTVDLLFVPLWTLLMPFLGPFLLSSSFIKNLYFI